MKHTTLIILIFLPTIFFSQKLKRTVFEYEKLPEVVSNCNEETKKELEKAYIALDEYNSSYAVKISKNAYNQHQECQEVFEVYAYCLFRSGEWLEGIDIIEKGINKFGSVPDLIKRKSQMSLEMAELGTGQKSIDGNAVYKANSMKYKEEQFKEENLKSALLDLEFLMKTYQRSEETYYVAKIYQMLEKYDKSSELFEKLLNDDEYKTNASFNVAENYIHLKKLDEAENELLSLLKTNLKEGVIYEKLSEIYVLKKDNVKAVEYTNKAIYYKNVPDFTDLEYSDENFELLKYFGTDENKGDKKIEKLNELYKTKSKENTVDICLIILKLHANHSNGLEERATEILNSIGSPAIYKVQQLFKSDVSTCTITNLADVMATVKDTASWTLLINYLPVIANMPMTLIPPSVPEKIVKFDEDKGITEILKVTKVLLGEHKENSSDPMADLAGFGQYVFYLPLQKIDKEKITKIAKGLEYSDEELKNLLEKIK